MNLSSPRNRPLAGHHLARRAIYLLVLLAASRALAEEDPTDMIRKLSQRVEQLEQ